MIDDKVILYLRKNKRKPLATGIYNECSYGTRAAIVQRFKDELPTNFFYINVWEQRNNWYDSSWNGRYIELHSIEECKKWLVKNFGGTWQVL